MGAVLKVTYASRGIIVSRRYLRFNRYSNLARYRGGFCCKLCLGDEG